MTLSKRKTEKRRVANAEINEEEKKSDNSFLTSKRNFLLHVNCVENTHIKLPLSLKLPISLNALAFPSQNVPSTHWTTPCLCPLKNRNCIKSSVGQTKRPENEKLRYKAHFSFDAITIRPSKCNASHSIQSVELKLTKFCSIYFLFHERPAP